MAGSCGLGEENVLFTLEHTGYRECMDACLHVSGCAWITWQEVQEACYLLASCNQTEECLLCVSGEVCGAGAGVRVELDPRGQGVSVMIDDQLWFRSVGTQQHLPIICLSQEHGHCLPPEWRGDLPECWQFKSRVNSDFLRQ